VDVNFILAFLIVVILVFEYFQTCQYLAVIKHLTQVIADLKSFVIGKPSLDRPRIPVIEPPSHPDFGLGNIIDELNEAEGGKEI